MKFLKIIIAFAVLYVFFGVIAFLVIAGSWMSTFWANSYARPIATIYVSQDDSRSVQVVTLRNGSALTAIFTRDLEQNGTAAQIIPLSLGENDKIFVRFATVALHEWLYPLGYTHMYKLHAIALPDGSIPYKRADQMLSTIELNGSVFTRFISNITIESIEIPVSESGATYDIMLTENGLSLEKRE